LIKSKTSVCYEIFREIEREGLRTSAQSICILANSEIANLLLEDERNTIEKMEVSLKKKIIVKMDNSFHQENYEIIPVQ
jgi:ribonuclease G